MSLLIARVTRTFAVVLMTFSFLLPVYAQDPLMLRARTQLPLYDSPPERVLFFPFVYHEPSRTDSTGEINANVTFEVVDTRRVIRWQQPSYWFSVRTIEDRPVEGWVNAGSYRDDAIGSSEQWELVAETPPE